VFVEALVINHGFDVNFLAMSTFAEGLDDRVYNRYLARCLTRRGHTPGDQIHVPDLPMAASDIVQQMQGASLNVCMRYHSVVFAHELNSGFLAVDYTGGGKIRSFLQDQGHEDRLLSIAQFSAGAWSRFIPELRARHACPAD